MRRLTSLFLLVGFLATTSAHAQLTPAEAATLMGRGINMGNTLEPETEGGWNNPPAREALFDYYTEAGFSTVRVPIRWDKHMGTTTPFTIQPSFLDRVEEIVDWGLERGLFVIINSHHDDWIKSGYADPVLRARFDAIWGQVATRFADKPDRLLFEIINEPFGMSRADVDDLNERVLGIIRETNPTRIVIFSGNEWSGAEQLIAAAVPDDPWLMGYYHSYDPWSFAGEGIGTWGAAERAQLRERVQRVAAWSETHGIPVMNSEFGVIRESDFNSRMRFYAAYVEEHLAVGMPFQVWDDGGWFRVLHREDGTWNDEKDLLLYAGIDGPTDVDARVVDDTTVVVRWANRSTEFGSIRLERSTSGGPYETVASLPASATTYTDTDITGQLTYTYRVVAVNALRGNRIGPPFRISIPAIAREAFGGAPASIPGIIEAEHYDVGGEGLTYHDTDTINQGQTFRVQEGVDIVSFTADAYQVGYMATGEWLEYTVRVETPGTYDVTVDVSSLEGGGLFVLKVGEVPSARLVAPATGDWATTVPVTTIMSLAEGVQVLRLSVLLARPFNVDRMTFSLVGATAVERMPTSGARAAVYPNPVTDEAWFAGPDDGHVRVFDARGRLVHTSQPGRKSRVVGLPGGTYFARFTTRDGAPVGTIPFIVL